MKVRLIKVFLLVMSFVAMMSSFPAFAATPDPLPADTEPQAIIKQLMQGESAWVSLPDPVDIEEVTSFRKTGELPTTEVAGFWISTHRSKCFPVSFPT